MKYKAFSKKLQIWDKISNKRAMPWKGEPDAYKIWLSEIILQQTRVEQGMAYYQKFIKNFPTVKHLAKAEEQKVFKLWEGLGYYSRCRNLIATAKYITEKHGGKFPDTYSEILNLKGVGPYTAAAIASFAYGLPHAVLDGNVFRVLARLFGIEIPIDSTEGKKEFAKLAGDLLDTRNSATHNQAIMDFGATVCKPTGPLCGDCIFNKNCIAFLQNKTNVLPVKTKRLQIKNRYFHIFIIEVKGKIAVRERVRNDIWRHLYEFPLLETNTPENPEKAIAAANKAGWLPSLEAQIKNISGVFIQKLTHQVVHANFIYAKLNKKPLNLVEYQWVKKGSLNNFAFPKIINLYLKSIKLY